MKKLICSSILGLALVSTASFADDAKTLTVSAYGVAGKYLCVETDNPFARQTKCGSNFKVTYNKNLFGNYPKVRFVSQQGGDVEVIKSDTCNIYKNYVDLPQKTNNFKINNIYCSTKANGQADCRTLIIDGGTCN